MVKTQTFISEKIVGYLDVAVVNQRGSNFEIRARGSVETKKQFLILFTLLKNQKFYSVTNTLLI